MSEEKSLKKWDFSRRHGKHILKEFADVFKKYQKRMDHKLSARGWCYLMEQEGFIHKGEFNKVNELLNRARKKGLLPVDFCISDISRQFYEVDFGTSDSPEEYIRKGINNLIDLPYSYDPFWWESMESEELGLKVEKEKYYIQVVVEKIDLVTLFLPVCRKFHIPIANTKGWQSIRQRAAYSRRFAVMQSMGYEPVLLYCGDHDPDGLRISDTIRKNLNDVKDIVWEDGTEGFDPRYLIIDRFGLNYDFIKEKKLTWIDNLITGGKKNGRELDLSDESHPNHNLPYVQDYIKKIGVRKCEANAIVVDPQGARDLVQGTIEEYLGEGALGRFAARKDIMVDRAQRAMAKLKLHKLSDDEENIVALNGLDEIGEELKSQLFS